MKALCAVALARICLKFVIASKSLGTKKLLPAGHGQSTQPAGPKVALHFPHLFVCALHLSCVQILHLLIVAIQPYFSRL